MGNLGVHMICMDFFLTRPFEKRLEKKSLPFFY